MSYKKSFLFVLFFTLLALVIGAQELTNPGTASVEGSAEGKWDFSLVKIFFILTSACTFATAITAITPSKHDNKIANAILKFVNLVAGNILKNKNKDA